MLLVGGRDFRRPMVSVTFNGLYFYLLKTCPCCKFYGAVSFIALPIYGGLLLKKISCKVVDVVVLFIYGFYEPISFCWARQPYSFEQ